MASVTNNIPVRIIGNDPELRHLLVLGFIRRQQKLMFISDSHISDDLVKLMVDWLGIEMVDPTEYRIPRNFKLLEEFEMVENNRYRRLRKKYGEDAMFITLSLSGQDPSFTNWNCSIIPHAVWLIHFIPSVVLKYGQNCGL